MSILGSQTRPPWILVAAGSSASKVIPLRRPGAITMVIAVAVLVVMAVAMLAIVIARQVAAAARSTTRREPRTCWRTSSCNHPWWTAMQTSWHPGTEPALINETYALGDDELDAFATPSPT